MKYRILFITPDGPDAFFEEQKDQPREWSNPKAAAEAATRWNKWYKDKGFPQRFRVVEHLTPEDTEKGKAWRERESTRLSDGTYVQVPWLTEKWFRDSRYATLHFPHLSQKKTEKGMLAYTPDETHGLEDRQVPIKVGRYLHKYFDHVLTGSDVADWCAKVGVEDEDIKLSFASKADEIEKVYREGPHSCMSYDRSHFQAKVHPSVGYTTGDVEIAYLTRYDSATDSMRITARCVTRPAKKTFGRVYGDVQRIVPLLNRLGYKEDLKGCLLGARIKRIVEGGAYIVPYIDNIKSGTSDGTYITIDGVGPITLQQGSCRAKVPECEYCGKRSDVIKRIPGGHNACDTCFGAHTAKCDFCNERGARETSGIRYKRDHWWCGNCEAGQAVLDRCNVCGKWHDRKKGFSEIPHFKYGTICNICVATSYAALTEGCRRVRNFAETCNCRLCVEVRPKPPEQQATLQQQSSYTVGGAAATTTTYVNFNPFIKQNGM